MKANRNKNDLFLWYLWVESMISLCKDENMLQIVYVAAFAMTDKSINTV